MGIQAELLLNQFMELGESPCWDEKLQTLYWVDTDNECIYRYCLEDGVCEKFQLDQKVGAVVKENSKTLIGALANGFYRINEENGSKEFLCNPEANIQTNIFNDGKCDEYGIFWAGTVDNEEREGKGSLYNLDSNLICMKALDGVTISNGITWSNDNTKMYYIDTPKKQVTVFDYDINNKTISSERVAVDLHKEDGMPDGMTIDEQDNLWVAMWGGSCVLRCNPNTGKVIDRIKLPVTNVTSCTFGGRDLDTLYITTAKAELTEKELIEQPLAGGIFSAKVGVKGRPSYRFGKKANR